MPHTVLFILIFVFTIVSAEEYQPPIESNEIRSMIIPKIFNGIKQNELLLSTEQESGDHQKYIIFEYTHQNETNIIDLYLNEDFLADENFLQSQNINGSENIEIFNEDSDNLCHYQGKIRNKPNSRVALSTCDGINGIVDDGKNSYQISPIKSYALNEPHYITSEDQTPIMIDTIFSPEHSLSTEQTARSNRIKRATGRGLFYVELVIVADNSVYKSNKKSVKRVRSYCKDIANGVNMLYKPMNIHIILVGVVIWTQRNEIGISKDSSVTLNNFYKYRIQKLNHIRSNDDAMLITNTAFLHGIYGLASVGTMCAEHSCGIVRNTGKASNVAELMAHEMGHNFGLNHDDKHCHCRARSCIMAPVSRSGVSQWSDCSRRYLLSLPSQRSQCLRNKPKTSKASKGHLKKSKKDKKKKSKF